MLLTYLSSHRGPKLFLVRAPLLACMKLPLALPTNLSLTLAVGLRPALRGQLIHLELEVGASYLMRFAGKHLHL
jgi:hypothetical protein